MKRGKKLILLMAVFVLLSTLSLLVPKLFPEEEITLEADTSISILTLDSEKISALSWSYENETMMFDYADGNWSYSMDTYFPTDNSYLETMVTDLCDLKVSKTITDPGELADYGLEEAVCSISVTEDSTTEILIGNSNAIGDSRYISIGDGNVYLTDSSLLNDFSYTLTDLIEMEEIPDMSTITDMTVTGTDRAYSITPETSDDATTWYHLENGNKIAVDTDLTNSLIDTICELNWISCTDYHADQDTLTDCGFSDPALTITITYESTAETDAEDTEETVTTSNTFTLEIGNAIDSYRYARISGSGMIYQIDESVYTSLAETTAEGLQTEAE